jgi:hypothetical protein
MVLPIIVAGARVAGTTVARTGAVAARKGVQGATRTTASAARKAAQSTGRAVTRSKNTPVLRNRMTNTSRPIDASQRNAGLQNNLESRIVNRARSTSSYVSNNSDVEDNSSGTLKNKRKPRINILIAILLVYVAFMFDIIEVILDIVGVGAGGWIKDFIQIPFFAATFWFLGVPFWKGNKRLAKIITVVTTSIISLIPIVSTVLPEATIGVLITILYTRLEDKFENQKELAQATRNILRSKRGR